ncbi:inositol monophosphatase family protein [Corynebacterium pygosceleis]|uniref:Inositol monophosphatase family protein n=1 Tax=Corynebacterium pygosceleis TaxID=2800406 RepID=A0A9Q4C9G4_9CORY|nr:inositol monophosphatase family protein [Corynebacterium pygosceleis]MCK7637760.1 inositol monophosphatase family protein [Corynebacterium pygosceleis]MCK7674951.1 inositol monophosphatase family protein [Corynebacterium pygosceleis]MCL0119460.1 inositol monophosphatase family protein [Corynebacterium pygosceleis]MCX7444700.1 inositol monophosphatase family protein [Corynebacterium pygosceleis]MCX7467910.1 inositol monophosphatase family protein [Corynebacterium pygosceleis]
MSELHQRNAPTTTPTPPTIRHTPHPTASVPDDLRELFGTDTRALVAAFIDTHRDSGDPELGCALVSTAGQLALALRDGGGLGVDYKTSVSDVVTEADRAAETFVAEALSSLRPRDGLLGEEGAARDSLSGRTWVIDPVDGTYNFTSGSDYFCSAIALVDGDPSDPERLHFGAVHRPSHGTTHLGGPEMPTTVNGRAVGRLAEAPAREISLATYIHPPFLADAAVREAWLAVSTRFATLRMLGAGSIDLSGVSEGRFGAWTQHSVADWDWLPGRALVEGAGGICRKIEAGGRTWCVAGNSRVVAEITIVWS